MPDCHFLLTVLLVGFSISQALYIVERVENPFYAEEYRCVDDAAPENTAYTWQREGWLTLPDGVQADGNRLQFLKSTSDLNGLYICTATTHNSINYASFYRYEHKTEDTFLNSIFHIVLGLWMQLNKFFCFTKSLLY
ncbi:uncharacterized protein LOC143512286 [Brachyhypopomus gauderio]|uniref:uncharacterized protein LOC143512286 n=1 Tax=Brachyhypopomus gauderio TaxID=698409 RepID=UPI004042A19B